MTEGSRGRAASEAAREALVVAAEELFAVNGFRGTSDRQIVLKAGQGNNSAIAYHFGSRDGLIDAIWFRHSAPVNLRRAEMMARMGDPPTLREMVDAHVDPIVEEMLVYQPSFWARFNEQNLLELPERFVGATTIGLSERTDGPPLMVLMHLFALMRDRLAEGGAGDTDLRVSLATRLLISALASWEREDDGSAGRRDRLVARAELIKSMAAGMLTQIPGDGAPGAGS